MPMMWISMDYLSAITITIYRVSCLRLMLSSPRSKVFFPTLGIDSRSNNLASRQVNLLLVAETAMAGAAP